MDKLIDTGDQKTPFTFISHFRILTPKWSPVRLIISNIEARWRRLLVDV